MANNTYLLYSVRGYNNTTWAFIPTELREKVEYYMEIISKSGGDYDVLAIEYGREFDLVVDEANDYLYNGILKEFGVITITENEIVRKEGMWAVHDMDDNFTVVGIITVAAAP